MTKPRNHGLHATRTPTRPGGRDTPPVFGNYTTSHNLMYLKVLTTNIKFTDIDLKLPTVNHGRGQQQSCAAVYESSDSSPLRVSCPPAQHHCLLNVFFFFCAYWRWKREGCWLLLSGPSGELRACLVPGFFSIISIMLGWGGRRMKALAPQRLGVLTKSASDAF